MRLQKLIHVYYSKNDHGQQTSYQKAYKLTSKSRMHLVAQFINLGNMETSAQT